MKIIRIVFSILFYITAGISIYMISLLSFINQPSWVAKYNSLNLFVVVAILALVLGATVAFWGWKSTTAGITLISSTGFALLVIVTIFYLSLSPKFKETFPNNNFDTFSDYKTGCITALVLLIAGSTLTELGRQKKTE